eukprot:7092516-Pyramimonas_sp.AAC.1
MPRPGCPCGTGAAGSGTCPPPSARAQPGRSLPAPLGKVAASREGRSAHKWPKLPSLPADGAHPARAALPNSASCQ